MELDFSNQTKQPLDTYLSIYEKLFSLALNFLDKGDNYFMSVTFVEKEQIHNLNLNYRNIDKETDVISFAFLDDKNEIICGDYPVDLGEIYICYDVALENAKRYGNSIERELSFLFIHGLLHLFGYDHMTKKDEEIMFPLQENILERMKFMKKEELLKKAIEAMELSYSPYSNFKVGAALVSKKGDVYLGANVENSAYGCTMCAERNALYNAYMHGVKKDDIEALAIVAECERAVSPCGQCRQVLSELYPEDKPIYLCNTNGEIKVSSTKELLPYAFEKDDLK